MHNDLLLLNRILFGHDVPGQPPEHEADNKPVSPPKSQAFTYVGFTSADEYQRHVERLRAALKRG